jgi:hypothetical protein
VSIVEMETILDIKKSREINNISQK